MPQAEFDIVIIGGGLAGASLAAALSGTAFKIAVIEAFEADSKAQPSFDERTIALTYSAKHIFSQIGAWTESVEAEACALKSIHISNKGHLGLTTLSHQDAGTPALGYVIPTRALGQALTKTLNNSQNIKFFCPFEAQAVTVKQDHAHITVCKPGQKTAQVLSAKLVIIADGGRSPIMQTLGFKHDTKHYPQSALLSIVNSNLPHKHKAYERFMSDGPLALLPMTKQRFAVVWTLSPCELKRIDALDDEGFVQALQKAFGMRAGLFSHASPRKTYPLSKSILQTPFSHRVLALGNAAHTVHPVAGQGFNLGLRDVATLAEQLIGISPEQDIGSLEFLKTYQQHRVQDTQRVSKFTDGLLTVFTHDSPIIQLGRNLGLIAVENLPFMKRALLRRTMGLSKNQPRLARGLKIR